MKVVVEREGNGYLAVLITPNDERHATRRLAGPPQPSPISLRQPTSRRDGCYASAAMQAKSRGCAKATQGWKSLLECLAICLLQPTTHADGLHAHLEISLSWNGRSSSSRLMKSCKTSGLNISAYDAPSCLTLRSVKMDEPCARTCTDGSQGTQPVP